MQIQHRHSGSFATPLAAALTALETLLPEDETTRVAILKILGYRPATKAAIELPMDAGIPEDFEIDDPDDREKRRRGLRVVSSGEQLPPMVPSYIHSMDDTGTSPPQWLDEASNIAIPVAVSDPFSEPIAPLLVPNYSRAIISRLAAQQLPLGEIDLTRILRMTERCLPFREVPRCLLPSLARGVQLLIDTHESMQPFRLDIRGLIGEILRTVGWDRVEILHFRSCPTWGVQQHPLKPDKEYQPPGAGRPVFIVTDLGIGLAEEAGARAGAASWRDFTGRLKRAGTRVTCLVPYGPAHWPEDLPDDLNPVAWDRTTTATSLKRGKRPSQRAATDHGPIAAIDPRLASVSPDAVRLGLLASMATRIEPQLLRQLRLKLAADLDAGAEAALWHSDLVQERAPTGIVMRADIRSLLQRRLAQMPQMFEATYDIIRRLHAGSAPVLQIEEKLIYFSLKGDTAGVRKLLRSMVATLVSPDRQGLAGWAGQAIMRLPREIMDFEEAQILATGVALRLGDPAAMERMRGGGSADMDWLMPRQREISIACNLRRGAVEFGPATMRDAHRILVPDTAIVIIELNARDEAGLWRRHYLRIRPGQRNLYEVDGEAFELNIIGGRRYQLAVALEADRSSSQKFVARNRAPRVRIEYDVELYDAVKKVELPFVIGVMAGLSGTSIVSGMPVSERKFINIDVDNFDECMAAIQPSMIFDIPNIEDDRDPLSVDLTFMRMEDFRPEAIVRRIPWLESIHRQIDRLKALAAAIAEKPILAGLMDSLVRVIADRINNASTQRFQPDLNEILDETLTASSTASEEFTSWDDQYQATIREALKVLPEVLMQIPRPASGKSADWINAVVEHIESQMGAQMRKIVHHPDFQELEGTWRGLYHLVANTETSERLKIKCLDISKRELYRVLARYMGKQWEQSPIFINIIEQELNVFGGEPYGCLVGDYYFDHSAQDVELLAYIARIAEAANAPFIAGAASSVMGLESWADLYAADDLHKPFMGADHAGWSSLRYSEASRFVALALPRFLARLPYSESTDPVDDFYFDELSDGNSADKFTWTNSAYAMAANIGRAFSLYGWCAKIRGVESGGLVENLPVSAFPAEEGGMDMKCPTEIAISDRSEMELARLGFMPLVHRNGTDFTAFFNAISLHKPAIYDDPDASANAQLAARLPYTFACCRFAHYLRCMVRDKIGSFMDRELLQRYLQRWIMLFVDPDSSNSSEASKATRPLAAAAVVIEDLEDETKPDSYFCSLYLRPHYQLEGLKESLRIGFILPSVQS